jgi:phosphoribosylaminoimidazole-succinocarboxamide synthase
MVVRDAAPIKAECIARGYLTGSGKKDYDRTGGVCGIPLPKGLVEASRLDPPIFTPSTKAEKGHDRNISFEELSVTVGDRTATTIKRGKLNVYSYARAVALERGIIIADTKLEFGYWDEEVILIDEVLTPDSSRFWPAQDYRPGQVQQSFDKQPVRDWLAKSGWDDKSGDPPPEIPGDIVAATTERYETAYRMLTGKELEA